MSQTYLPPVKPGIASRVRSWLGPRIVTQVLTVLVVLALFYLLGQNTITAMERAGIRPGFAFLNYPANFQIGETVIPFRAGDIYARAMLVGLLNTFRVAVLGCLLATILGVTVGIAGLSRNLLLSGIARVYVETIRNTPLLLQLFFWVSLTKAFAPPRQASPLLDSVFLTNRGVYFPSLVVENLPAGVLWSVGALTMAYGLFLWTARRRERLTFGRGLLATLALGAAAVAVFTLAGGRVSLDVPAPSGFNIRGGASISPEYAALLVGLTVKFSAAIAEIVRAGIQSVSEGQREAARALGMRPGQIMRLIVIPQALRVITPLITSSYLDLTKDSSLAVAIGYPDLVSVINTTANTTGQAFEALLILVAVFVTINLSVSYLMNIYNQRVALRGGRPQ